MDNLLTKLESMRAQMIHSGITYGFLHEQTIRLSEQLDELLNLYYMEQHTVKQIVGQEN